MGSMRGNAGLVALVVLFGCGEIVKKAPDGGGDDGAIDGVVDDGDISLIDGPPIDVPPGAPNIAAMTPDWGSTAGGTNVKITGIGFSEPNLVVRFGTVNAATVTVVSDTELRVVTAAGPHMAVDLVVTTSGGMSTFPIKFRNLAPLYGADSRKGATKNFYMINPVNAQATVIGAMGAAVTGLALSPAGIMYGMAGPVAVGQPNRLVTINVYTGALTTVGNLPNGSSPDIAFVGGQLVGWGGPAGQPKNRMAVINTTTVVHTYSAASMTCGGCGMAATSASSMVFAPNNASGILYSVNTANGVASAGPTMNSTVTPAESVFGLTFVGNTLYAAIGNFPTPTTQTNRLVTINPQTGAITARGTLPVDIDAIEGIPTQPVIAKTAGDPQAELADELATIVTRFDNRTGSSVTPSLDITIGPPTTTGAPTETPTVTWRGERLTTNELVARGTEREIDGQTRRVVSLSSLADGARTAILVIGNQSHRIAIEPGHALVQNRRGELKLIDTRAGAKKLYGPITELRFAR